MKSSLIVVALAIGANADGHTDDIATYQPASDVEEHAKIDLDFRNFDRELEQGEWDDAWATYADGGHSDKGDGFLWCIPHQSERASVLPPVAPS